VKRKDAMGRNLAWRAKHVFRLWAPIMEIPESLKKHRLPLSGSAPQGIMASEAINEIDAAIRAAL